MLWILPFFTWGAAAATSAWAALYLYLLAIITGWMVHILTYSTGKVPKKKWMFDKDTII